MERCANCDGRGVVCFNCAKVEAGCECEYDFDPIWCDGCDGTGEINKEDEEEDQ